MRINASTGAIHSARRSLETSAKAIARSLERMATGKRVNEAKDGASDLARATGLERDISAMRRGILNVAEAKGLLNTASTALGS